MTRCPSCGSSKTHQSHNRNEFSCVYCESLFNAITNKVFIEGDYKKFCGSVASLITENMSDTNLGSSIKEIIIGYENENPKEVNLLVERLVDIAQDLYNDYQMGRRDKYDFGALLEGINTFNQFADIQNPQENNPEETMAGVDSSVEIPNGEVPAVDPMDMLSNTDGPIEVGEHSALEELKNAICAVQCAIQSLESAGSQENSAGEINGGGLAANPVDAFATEGLQTGAIDSPIMGTMSAPASSILDVPPTEIAPAGNEGPEHEADEQGALSQLKASLAQLQSAYASYVGSEEKVHDTQPTSGDFTDKLNALSGIDSGVDSQTFLEKAKELMEDAQLVNQGWLKKDLDNSIAVNTQEIGESTFSVFPAPGQPKFIVKVNIWSNFNPPSKQVYYYKHAQFPEPATLTLNPDEATELSQSYAQDIVRLGCKCQLNGKPKTLLPGLSKAVPAQEIRKGEVDGAMSENDPHTTDPHITETNGKFYVVYYDHNEEEAIDGPYDNLDDAENVLAEIESSHDDSQQSDSLPPQRDRTDDVLSGDFSSGDERDFGFDENKGTESGEITDQPGEVHPENDIDPDDLKLAMTPGTIHTDDVSKKFSPENVFKPEDNVIYENKQHVVIAIDGKHLTIRNPKNGHTIEVLAEDINYANSEDVDIRGQRFDESNNTLLAAWEKIEKTINEENLNAPKRSYDLRTNRYTEGF